MSQLVHRRNSDIKPVVMLAVYRLIVVTSVMSTASLAHSQTPGSPSGAPSATAQDTPAKVPFEAQVLYVEVKDPKDPKHKTEVALGNYIVIALDTELTTPRQQQTPANKLGLFINDLFIKGLELLAVPGQPKSLMFELKRTDDNRDAWSVLFGRKHFGLGSSKTGDCDSNDQIAVTVGLQDGSWAAKNSKPPLCLEYLPDNASKFLILPISFVVAIGTIILGMKSSMLRDSGDPRTDGKLGAYSLGRCQMALWFVTVVFGFLFTYAVAGDTSPIPQGVLILMGIGAGTALGAAAIDQNKRTASNTDLANWTAEKVALAQQIQDLQSKIANTPGDPNVLVLQQQQQTAQQRLLAVSAQLTQIPSTQVAASEGFIRDVLSDVNGISFHRVQMFGWTLVFWAVLLSSLFKKVTMVDFDTTQLALMGISGSTYLGFKLQEKKS